jgi:hypothetical protein
MRCRGQNGRFAAGIYFAPENWYFLCPSIPLELGVVW